MSLIQDKIFTYLEKDDVEDNEEVVSAYTIKQLGEDYLSEQSEAYNTRELRNKINQYLKFIYDNRYNENENWHYDIIDEKKHHCKNIIPFINYDEKKIGLLFEFRKDEAELIYKKFNKDGDSEDFYANSSNPILTAIFLTNGYGAILKQFAALQKYAERFYKLYPKNPSRNNPITTSVNDDTFNAMFSYDGIGSFHSRVSLINEPEDEKTRFLIKTTKDDILRKLPVRVSELSPTLQLLVKEKLSTKENVSVY